MRALFSGTNRHRFRDAYNEGLRESRRRDLENWEDAEDVQDAELDDGRIQENMLGDNFPEVESTGSLDYNCEQQLDLRRLVLVCWRSSLDLSAAPRSLFDIYKFEDRRWATMS